MESCVQEAKAKMAKGDKKGAFAVSLPDDDGGQP
jgi:hypothetical protein